MYQGEKIAVVVPAFNVAHLVGRVLKTMPPYVDCVFVVDDASRDGTAGIVEKFLERDPRVRLLRHAENAGVGAAISTGYLKAREEKFDAVAVMAGDAQMDPADLPHLLDPVVEGEVDYAKGNRLFRGESWEMIPHHRYLGNAVLSLLTKIASGYWHVADSQCGYTVASLSVLDRLHLHEIYPRYGVPNDILIRLNILDFRVRDVSVRPIYNIGERSGIRFWNVIPRISFLLFKGFFRRLFLKYVIRDFHPLVFFYALGLVLLPAGILFGGYLLLHRLLFGPVAATSALFAAFLAISGLQSLFFAMWFDMEYNKHLR